VRVCVWEGGLCCFTAAWSGLWGHSCVTHGKQALSSCSRLSLLLELGCAVPLLSTAGGLPSSDCVSPQLNQQYSLIRLLLPMLHLADAVSVLAAAACAAASPPPPRVPRLIHTPHTQVQGCQVVGEGAPLAACPGQQPGGLPEPQVDMSCYLIWWPYDQSCDI
jgi:hypothetical protein